MLCNTLCDVLCGICILKSHKQIEAWVEICIVCMFCNTFALYYKLPFIIFYAKYVYICYNYSYTSDYISMSKALYFMSCNSNIIYICNCYINYLALAICFMIY